MKFKFLNINISLPDETTVHDALRIEDKIRAWLVASGYTSGTIGLDSQDDITKAPVPVSPVVKP